jgi:hypothetical protein
MIHEKVAELNPSCVLCGYINRAFHNVLHDYKHL